MVEKKTGSPTQEQLSKKRITDVLLNVLRRMRKKPKDSDIHRLRVLQAEHPNTFNLAVQELSPDILHTVSLESGESQQDFEQVTLLSLDDFILDASEYSYYTEYLADHSFSSELHPTMKGDLLINDLVGIKRRVQELLRDAPVSEEDKKKMLKRGILPFAFVLASLDDNTVFYRSTSPQVVGKDFTLDPKLALDYGAVHSDRVLETISWGELKMMLRSSEAKISFAGWEGWTHANISVDHIVEQLRTFKRFTADQNATFNKVDRRMSIIPSSTDEIQLDFPADVHKLEWYVETENNPSYTIVLFFDTELKKYQIVYRYAVFSDISQIKDNYLSPVKLNNRSLPEANYQLPATQEMVAVEDGDIISMGDTNLQFQISESWAKLVTV